MEEKIAMIPLMVEEDCKLSPAARCCLCLHGAELREMVCQCRRQDSTRQGLAWTVRVITHRSLSPSLVLPSDTPNMSMSRRILGSRMYYSFWESAVDTDEKFMEQMDALCMGECLDLSSSLPCKLLLPTLPCPKLSVACAVRDRRPRQGQLGGAGRRSASRSSAG